MEKNIITIDLKVLSEMRQNQDSKILKKIEVAAQQVADAVQFALAVGQKSKPKSRVSKLLLNLSKRLE